jgi:glycosyltransferase involved in cell wall biosynthesis
MPDRRLVVVGDGPEYSKVAWRATPNVEVLGYQDDEALVRHLQRAKALIFAADEDFGILPVEAQACGTPVIALGRGGALETVLDGETGAFFDEQTPEAIRAAVERFERQPPAFSAGEIREHALQFGEGRFCSELAELVSRSWEAFQARDAFGQAGENRSDALPDFAANSRLV